MNKYRETKEQLTVPRKLERWLVLLTLKINSEKLHFHPNFYTLLLRAVIKETFLLFRRGTFSAFQVNARNIRFYLNLNYLYNIYKNKS